MGRFGDFKRRFGFSAVVVVCAALMPLVHVTSARAVNGSPQLTFPWGNPGNSDGSSSQARFNYGPHDYAGLDTTIHDLPWNSLDLAPTDYRVYATRGGVAYVECGGERIKVVHGDGYITTYLHLFPTSVRIVSGTYVTRNTWLARVIRDTDHYIENCGRGTQNHLHFSLWYVQPGDTFNYYNSQSVDWGAVSPTAATPVPGQPQIGSWTVNDGSESYSGCMNPITSPNTQVCGLPSYNNYIYNDFLSSQVPTARRPGGQTEDLFVRGLSVSAWWAPTDSAGNPTSWANLGGLFKGSITGVWNGAGTELDVFGVGLADNIWYDKCNTSSCANWALVSGCSNSVGPGVTETVNAERRADGGVDLFTVAPGGTAQRVVLDPTLACQFIDQLGTPSGTGIAGPPSGRWNSAGTRLDVFVIGGDNHPYRRSLVCGYPYCNWDPAWTGPLPGTAASATPSTSNVTGSITEDVMVVRAPDDTLDLFFVGTAHDGFHESLDQYGNYIRIDSLGGILKAAPDAKWDAYKSELDVFAIGANDQAWEITWTPSGWSPSWRLLPNNGISG